MKVLIWLGCIFLYSSVQTMMMSTGSFDGLTAMVLAVILVFLPAPWLCKQYTKWKMKHDAEKQDEAASGTLPLQEPQTEAELEITEEAKTDEEESDAADQDTEQFSNIIVLDMVSAEDESETEAKHESNKKTKWVVPVLALWCCILAVAVCVLGYMVYQQNAGIATLETSVESAQRMQKRAEDIVRQVQAEKSNLYTENYKLRSENRFWENSAVIVIQAGGRYHRHGCPHTEGKSFWIYNVEAAQSLGCTPCLDCKPPDPQQTESTPPKVTAPKFTLRRE